MAGGYKMLIRSIALAALMFIPTNLHEAKVERQNVTAIYYNPAPAKWLLGPKIADRVPVAEVVTVPTQPIAIPRSKPTLGKPILIKKPKPDTRRCRKGEKIWRTLPNGYRKYRLRRTC